MIFHQYPEWTAAIRNHYWHLRYRRGYDEARRRKEYRRIEAEKKRLQSEGVDFELIRLLCRHLVNLQNRRAELRWWSAYNGTKAAAEFLQKSL